MVIVELLGPERGFRFPILYTIGLFEAFSTRTRRDGTVREGIAI